MDTITKEMTNLGITFTILNEGKKSLPGWTKASGNLVFDVKMDFTRKARWVKDGHRTPDPTTSAYAGVVSRESVRVGLTYADSHLFSLGDSSFFPPIGVYFAYLFVGD